MFGWALPVRPGTRPLRKKLSAWVQQRNGAIVQRGFHELAFTALFSFGQRQQDADRRVEPRHHVHYGQSYPQRIATGSPLTLISPHIACVQAS
jgi:hypothetical protein